MSETRILVNTVHPNLSKSVGNQALITGVTDLADVTVRDLYAEYPDWRIDVALEQQLLVEHDVIVFQHPLYWGSSPALLKEWLDRVLERGFAFPPGKGDALKGKKWQQAVTVGGPENSYDGLGGRFTLDELLCPFQSVANFCGMQWQKPFLVYGVVQTGMMDAEGISADRLNAAGSAYRELLEGFKT